MKKVYVDEGFFECLGNNGNAKINGKKTQKHKPRNCRNIKDLKVPEIVIRFMFS